MAMESKRPKLHIAMSKLEIILEIISVIAFILTWVYIIISWSKMPSIIPTRFSSGQVTAYGSKNTLFIIPIIATIMFILFNILARFPHVFNYRVKITEENAERQYRNGRLIMEAMGMEMSILFLYLDYILIEVALKRFSNFGIQLLPVFIIVLIGTVLYLSSRMKKLK